MFVDFHILNELGSPSINSNTFANRPPAGQIGRLFVSTDTYEIYRDNGTTWDLIGGPGSSTVTGTGAATQVAYWTASQAIGGSNNLWWDNTGGYLGVKTNSPTAGVTVVQTDGQGILSEFTTVAGSGSGAVAVYAKNTTNASGFAAIFEESTPNSSSGQYPIKIMHSLSSGTAAANMATGIHFSLPDDAGTERINQLSMDTVDPAAATYTSRYRFVLRNAGAAATPFYVTGAGLGVFVASPSGLIHADGGASAARMILDADAGVARIFSFRSDNLPRWALRVDGAETGSNAGADFAIRAYNDTGAFTFAPLTIARATGKSSWQATEAYSTGLARANYFDYNLSVAAGGSFSSPNSISAVGASLDLTLAGNATIPSGARSGLDAYNTVNFTGSGTLTHNQGSQIRAYSNLTAGWAFAGSATGTITHLAGLRVLFPDNSGSAVSVTNNYGLLINDQTANTGTVTYTNRWGIYQEGTSDLNYFSANTLIGTTVNNGEKLQVNGAIFSSSNTVLTNTKGAIFDFNDGQNAGRILSYKATGSNLLFYTNPNGGSLTLAATIDSIGNLGLGVTPSAWASGWKVMQVGGTVSVYNSGSIGINTYNAYFNGTNYLYQNSAVAAVYDFNGAAAGGFAWRIGSSGTAGNAISFTQDMTLSSTGNLLIGTTQNVARLTVVGGSSNTGLEISNGSDYIFLQSYDRVAATHRDMYFYTTGPATMILKNSGNVLIGTTTDSGEKLQVNGTTKTSKVQYSSNIIANSTNTNLAAGIGATNFFSGTLANTEKCGQAGGTYTFGYYIIMIEIPTVGRGHGIFAFTNQSSNGGFTLISGTGITWSTTYNAAGAVSFAFDGSSNGPFIVNNSGATATIYMYVTGGA